MFFFCLILCLCLSIFNSSLLSQLLLGKSCNLTREILQDLRITYEEPIKVFWDNKSAISVGHDPMYHDRIKHVKIDRFYIKEKLEEKILSTVHINTTEQCAHIFAKGLPTKLFSKLCSKLGMNNIHSCT